MKIQNYLVLLCCFGLYNCQDNVQDSIILEQTPAYDLVNPFIGTGGHGHKYPGATLPFGMYTVISSVPLPAFLDNSSNVFLIL